MNSGRINRGEVNITIFSLRTGLNLPGYPSLRFFLHLILKYFKNYFEIDLSLGINTRSTSTFYCSVIIKSTIDTIVYFLYRFCMFSVSYYVHFSWKTGIECNHWIARTKNMNKIITMVLKALNVPVDTCCFSLCWRPFENWKIKVYTAQ